MCFCLNWFLVDQANLPVIIFIRGVIHVFEEQIICQNQNVFFEILGLDPIPLEHHIFWKKHPREKCQRVDSPLFFSFRGGHFLQFYPSASKLQFFDKMSTFSLYWGFRGKIAALRHLECFFLRKKTLLKLKNNEDLLTW